jgi:hypothetical protein
VQPSNYPPGAGRPDEYGAEQYGRSSGGWDSSTWPPEPVTVRRTRSWAVAVAAFLAGLVLMAAIGNPSVTDTIRKHITGHSFKDGVLFSVNSVQWRFGAGTGDTTRIWVQHLVNDIATLVLIFLLVWIVANARGGFWQAFFGTWACAVASFMVATYAGTAVLNQSDEQSSKAVLVFFGPTTSPATTLFGALMYGFVIALVAGLVAVTSRKREVMIDATAETAPAPGHYLSAQQQPQDSAGYPPAPGPVATPSPWSGSGGPGDGDHPTESLPRTEEQDRGPHPTAVLPSVEGTDQPTGSTSPAEPQDGEQHTTQLPRTGEPPAGDPNTDTDTGRDEWPPPRRDG